MNRDSLFNRRHVSIASDDEDPISNSSPDGLEPKSIPDGGGFAKAETLSKPHDEDRFFIFSDDEAFIPDDEDNISNSSPDGLEPKSIPDGGGFAKAETLSKPHDEDRFFIFSDDEDNISNSSPDGLEPKSIPDGGGFAKAENLNALTVSILSIDGGGIRGIIPASILCFLESQLQKYDPGARIADYFDTMAVTSTGGLIAAMLTCPDEHGQPLFTAQEILDFYLEHSPEIFPQTRKRCCGLRHLAMAIRFCGGPKYDGEHLRSVIRKLLVETRLRDTLTDVVMVAYDTLKNLPVIFSSREIKNSPFQGPLLSDVCIATSAAPTYLPPHYFKATDASGEEVEYNVVDGGLAANNPTLLAINETVSKLTGGTDDYAEARKQRQFLVLSIGTGTKREDGYPTSETKKWGLLGWRKIVKMFFRGIEDMVEKNLRPAIKTLGAEYLRIQAHNLEGDISSLDKATTENLNNLKKLGEKLTETYAEALTRFAKLLSEGRKRRLALEKKTGTKSLVRANPIRGISQDTGARSFGARESMVDFSVIKRIKQNNKKIEKG